MNILMMFFIILSLNVLPVRVARFFMLTAELHCCGSTPSYFPTAKVLNKSQTAKLFELNKVNRIK